MSVSPHVVVIVEGWHFTLSRRLPRGRLGLCRTGADNVIMRVMDAIMAFLGILANGRVLGRFRSYRVAVNVVGNAASRECGRGKMVGPAGLEPATRPL